MIVNMTEQLKKNRITKGQQRNQRDGKNWATSWENLF